MERFIYLLTTNMTNTKLVTVFGIVVVSCILFMSTAIGFTDEARKNEENLRIEIANLQKGIDIAEAAFPARAEAARQHRAHCTMADHAEQELTSMQQAIAAQRKQIEILTSLLPKAIPSQ